MFDGRSIFQPAHAQRSTLNQSRRDRAARDTSGVHAVLQSLSESVNEFCLPRFRPDRWERHPWVQVQRPRFHPLHLYLRSWPRNGPDEDESSEKQEEPEAAQCCSIVPISKCTGLGDFRRLFSQRRQNALRLTKRQTSELL
jgi:hypothetical protein